MIYIVLAILLIEVVRLILAIDDRQRVNKLNKQVMEATQKRYEEDKLMRRAELVQLKELARGSDALKEIYQDFQKLQEKESER